MNTYTSPCSRALQILLVLCIVLFGSSLEKLHAQTRIEGAVRDSLAQPLEAASVMLLRASDSVMQSFTLSKPDGTFFFPRVKEGQYLLHISYLGYAPQYHDLKLSLEKATLEVGNLQLEPLSTTLDQVTIEGDRAPIRMRRDTIEYNADAFKTQPNAVVEDLLKKLPGVEVERDGTIKAQGEEVRKVLVEGKEFFGNDPKIATKNLPADAIDKVQVFDKLSDMAEFTGIEDGQDEKTLNLALKEGKKTGVFGKVGAAYGTDDRYRVRSNLNKFNKRLQLSFIGNSNNINQQGFSMNDYIGFMGGLGNMGSGMGLSFGGNDNPVPLNMGRSNGFVTTATGGVNFNYDLSPKTDFRSSYFFNYLNQEQMRTVQRENLLRNSLFSSLDSSQQESQNYNHRVNLFLKHEFDSSQQLIFRGNFQGNDARFSSQSTARVLNSEGILENGNERENRSDSDQLRFNSRLTYRKRLGKKGRTTALTLEARSSDIDTDLELLSQNRFFLDRLDRFVFDTLFQSQLQRDDQINWGATWNYTEPLGKGWTGGLTYAFRNYSNETDKAFFDLDETNRRFRNFNPELSNSFAQDYVYNRPGLTLQLSRGKWLLQGKMEYQRARLQGTTQRVLSPVDRVFSNFLPSFSSTYEFSTSRNIELTYTTLIREPSINQLQPIVDNSNPLLIYTGNPSLRPAYVHQVNLNYFSYVQFSQTSLFAHILGTYTQDQIVQAIEIDSLFRRQIRPINVDYDYMLRGYVSFGAPIRSLGTRVGLDLNYTYNQGLAFINREENQNTRHNRSIRLKLENRKKDHVDVTAGVRLGESRSAYSQTTEFSQRFFTQRYFIDVVWTPGPTWSFSSTLDYDIYSGESFGAKQEIALWQLALSKYVFPNQRGEISLNVFDVLNQNQGINRTTQLTYVEEERIISLGRYVLFGFTYSLSKFGLKQNSGGLRIETHR